MCHLGKKQWQWWILEFKKEGGRFSVGVKGKAPINWQYIGTKLPDAERFAYQTTNVISIFVHFPPNFMQFAWAHRQRGATNSLGAEPHPLPPRNPPPNSGDVGGDHTYMRSQSQQRTHTRKQHVAMATTVTSRVT